MVLCCFTGFARGIFEPAANIVMAPEQSNKSVLEGTIALCSGAAGYPCIIAVRATNDKDVSVPCA